MSQLPRCERCEREVAPDALFCPMCGAPRVRSDDSLIGSLVADRYLVHQRLGHGGSGNIYYAEHVTLRRRVAIKVLHHELSRDDLAIERFRREATTVSQIDNEHIVEVLDFGRLPDGRLFLAMEYLEGETLGDELAREGPLPIKKVVDVLIQLGEALMEAHAMGYIHRDLRPRNVFLARRRGRDGYVKLLDFGLAKLVEREGEAASTSLGMTFGDPHYMSPEQAHGEPVDRRGDIYSLGVIAFQMLTGRPPFLGEKVFDVLTAHLENTPATPSSLRKDVPAWLDAVVLRMLAKSPEDRFVTVYRLVEALREGQSSGVIMSDEVARKTLTAPPPAPAPRSREYEVATEPTLHPLAGAPMAASNVGPPPPQPDPMASAQTSPGIAPAPAPAAAVPVPLPAGKHSGKHGTSEPAGISGAWYADGEAMEDDARRGGRERSGTAQMTAPPRNGSKRNSWSQDVEYDDSGARRKKLVIGAVVGVVLLGGLALVLAVAGRGGSEARPKAALAADAGIEAAADAHVAAAVDTASDAAVAAVVSVDAAVAAPDAAAKHAAVPAPRTAPVPEPKPLKAEVSKPKANDRPTGLVATRPSGGGGGTSGGHFNSNPAPGTAIGGAIGATGGGAGLPLPESPESADAAQAEFYVKLGRTALGKNDTVSAASNFMKAREFDAKNADAIAGLGEVALQQGLYNDAVVHLEAAARLAPRSARILTLLGQAYMGASRPKKAADAFKRALKVDPNNETARRGYEDANRAP